MKRGVFNEKVVVAKSSRAEDFFGLLKKDENINVTDSAGASDKGRLAPGPRILLRQVLPIKFQNAGGRGLRDEATKRRGREEPFIFTET